MAAPNSNAKCDQKRIENNKCDTSRINTFRKHNRFVNTILSIFERFEYLTPFADIQSNTHNKDYQSLSSQDQV